MKTESKKAYYRAAADLDAALRKANRAHAELVEKREKASEAVTATRNSGKYDYAAQARHEEAKVAFNAANNSLLHDVSGVWDEYSKTVQTIRAQLVNDLGKTDVYSAADVDTSALALLQSGVMRTQDFAKMAEDYKENATVLALMRQKAGERLAALDKPGDFEERAALRNVIDGAKTDGEKLLETFDGLCNAARSFHHYDDRMGFPSKTDVRYCFPLSNWEQIAGPYIHEPEEGEE